MGRPDDDARDEIRRELARQLLGAGVLIIAVSLGDPVQRRNARLALERRLRSARLWFTYPIPIPGVAEVAALQEEARTITREAARDERQ